MSKTFGDCIFTTDARGRPYVIISTDYRQAELNLSLRSKSVIYHGAAGREKL